MTTNTKPVAPASNPNIGDLIRFTGEDYPDWIGQEGVVTRLDGESVQYRITKAAPSNLDKWWNRVGDNRQNDARNLTVITEALAEDVVNDAPHYGGKDNPYEVIKVAEAWGLDKDSYLFNVLKYIGRADKKGASLQDHKKARYYLDRKIKRLEEAAK